MVSMLELVASPPAPRVNVLSAPLALMRLTGDVSVMLIDLALAGVLIPIVKNPGALFGPRTMMSSAKDGTPVGDQFVDIAQLPLLGPIHVDEIAARGITPATTDASEI